MKSTIEIHVGQTDPRERLHVTGDLTGPGEIPSLTFSIRGHDGSDLVLFLWGQPGQVWDQLDEIIDAAASVKRLIAERQVREGIDSRDPNYVPQPHEIVRQNTPSQTARSSWFQRRSE